MPDTKKPTRDVELARRKGLTFEEAEGVEALPAQLALQELSSKLRAYLWEAIYTSINQYTDDIEPRDVTEPWATILYDKHVHRDHKMMDDYSERVSSVVPPLKAIYQHGTFFQVFGITQWILRHKECPKEIAGWVSDALEEARAAYRLIDGDTFMPISSEEEAGAVQAALDETAASGFAGPRTHLKNAGQHLTNGEWAASIRESIHAVEAAAKLIAPSAKTLDPALAEIAKHGNLHGSMQAGFSKLYGFTSDEKGIRHSLLEKSEAEVDEADAQFMLGACAAFVSYLLARARQGMGKTATPGLAP